MVIAKTAPTVVPPDDIARLRDEGALFAVNRSGGKDSQAMLIALTSNVPVEQIGPRPCDPPICSPSTTPSNARPATPCAPPASTGDGRG